MLQIVKIVLPVVTAFFVGILCRKFNILNDNGNQQIKNLLQEVIIPFSLFNAMLFSGISAKSLVFIFATFIAMLSAYMLAYVFRRFFIKDYQKYFPEMMTSWEGGSLGISLCSLLLGTIGLSTMAVCDLGNAFFLFGIVVPMLKVKAGAKSSIKDILKIVFSTKPFIGIVLGAICGALGLNRLISSNEVLSVVYHGIFDIISLPINFLIMLVVGYGLNISKPLIKPVILTCICRLIFMTFAFLLSCFIIFKFIPFDKNILLVLAIGYSLPQSFGYPIFSDFENREYLSTTLSVMTVVCLVLFVVISSIATLS